MEGDNPVHGWEPVCLRYVLKESGCLGMQPKMGGKFHLRLNIATRPIANKYREGKMKRTLKRELNKCVKPLKGKQMALAFVPFVINQAS